MQFLRSTYYILILVVYLTTFFNASLTCFSYEMNKEQITFTYCENQDKPEMNCNGKCFLMKRLSGTEESDTPTVLDNRVTTVWLTSEKESLQMSDVSKRMKRFSLYIDSYVPLYLDHIEHPPQV